LMWVVCCNGQLGSVWGRETERDRRCGRRKKGWRRGRSLAAEGKKKIKNRGAGGFFFLGLEIGLGCFFCIFSYVSKIDPPL
jgi:hypothetical protein